MWVLNRKSRVGLFINIVCLNSATVSWFKTKAEKIVICFYRIRYFVNTGHPNFFKHCVYSKQQNIIIVRWRSNRVINIAAKVSNVVRTTKNRK